MGQSIHLTKPKILSKKARPPLWTVADALRSDEPLELSA